MKDALIIAGLLLSLLLYGILQERLMTVGFGTEGEHFRSSLFLVFCNRTFTWVGCLVFALVTDKWTVAKPSSPLAGYLAISCCNVVATTCQYEALRYVSFALQTLAKTAKSVPVILIGRFVHKKSYSREQYVMAALISVGCSVFVIGGNIASKVAEPDKSRLDIIRMGVLLLVIYLAADGLTSTTQERLFNQYSTGVWEQLFYTNLISASFSMAAAAWAGHFWVAIAFLSKHKDAACYVLAISAVSASQQLFIIVAIKAYGALMFSVIMTLRQLLSILASTVIFGNPLTEQQALGLALVLLAFVYQTRRAFREHRPAVAEHEASPDVVRDDGKVLVTVDDERRERAVHRHLPNVNSP